MLAFPEKDPLLKEENGDVVVQPSGIVVVVDPDCVDGELSVDFTLPWGFAAGVVLYHANLQLVSALDSFEFVCGGDDPVGSPRDVVVSVVWHDGASPNEVIVGFQDQARPGKLVGLCLSFVSGDIIARKPFTALVSAVDAGHDVGVGTALIPGHIGVGAPGVGLAEGPHTAQLERGTVTARPGAGRTRSMKLVIGRSVDNPGADFEVVGSLPLGTTVLGQ